MGVGVPLGTLIFLATLASLTREAHPEEHLALLAQYFVGYSVRPTGALIGLVWGFVLGYLLGWLFALLRNLTVWIYLVSLPSRADTE